jgi:nucleoside-diphosphate-sugar epimerase
MAESAPERFTGRDPTMAKQALIVGVTSIVGTSLADRLLSKGWEVFGLSRRPPGDVEGLAP